MSDILRELEKLATDSESARYVLRLYVAGTTPRSSRAIANIKAICDSRLKGRYDLEVIDLYEDPTASRDEQVAVAPTLVRRLPLPLRRLIGDLSNRPRVLLALDIKPEEAA